MWFVCIYTLWASRNQYEMCILLLGLEKVGMAVAALAFPFDPGIQQVIF